MTTAAVVTWILGALLCITLTARVSSAFGILADEPVSLCFVVLIVWGAASLGTGFALAYDISGGEGPRDNESFVLGGLAGLGWCPVAYFIVVYAGRVVPGKKLPTLSGRSQLIINIVAFMSSILGILSFYLQHLR